MKPNINDRSQLKQITRSLTENNVTSSAVAVLEKALARGVTFKTPEDLTILNILPKDLAVIGGLVDFGPSDVVVKNIKTVEYKFILDGEAAFFFGYQLLVTFINRNGFTVQQSFPIENLNIVLVDYDLNDLAAGSGVSLRVQTAQGEQANISLQSSPGAPNELVIEFPISALANASIKVAVSAPELPPNPRVTETYGVRGRLISRGPNAKSDEYQIVLLASTTPLQSPTELVFFPVAFATTETNGYFVTDPLLLDNPADLDKITAAKALVTKGAFKAEVPIRLITGVAADGETPTSRIPARIILVSEDGTGAPKTGDCSCNDLDFHQKKVLEEQSFYTVVRTSEPSIIADVLEDQPDVNLEEIYGFPGFVPFKIFQKFYQIENRQTKAVTPRLSTATLSSAASTVNAGVSPFAIPGPTFNKALLDRLVLEYKAETIIRGNDKPVFKGRVHLDQLNQIDWDNEPTIYQAASIAHGHLLHFKQEWTPDGYSIGDLVYSLPLAPGQKKQIAVLDWERRESSANTQALDFEESLANSLSRDRDISEIISGTLSENIRGNSRSTVSGGGFGFGASVLGVIPGLGSFGSLLGISGGSTTSRANASQSATRENTVNSLQSISDRTQQAASVVRSQRATVVQTVSQGERVQATAESVANYNHCHAITIQYFEVLRHFAITNRLADAQECLFVPMQMSPFTLDKVLRWRNSLERHLFRRQLRNAFDAVARIQNEKESSFEHYYDSIGYPRTHFAEQPMTAYSGELLIEFFFFNVNQEKIDNDIILFFSVFGISLDSLRDRKITDEELANVVGPRTVEFLLDAFTVETNAQIDLKLDLSLLSTFRQNTPLRVSLRQSAGTRTDIRREQIDAINIKLDLGKLSSQAAGSLQQFQDKYMKIRLRSGNLRYRTAGRSGNLFSGGIDNDIFAGSDGAFIPTPLTPEELRNPRGEDVELANNLIHHLNENLEHYHKCIFFDMTPERRFMLLDGIVAPGKANGRSIASVVENRVIGIVGNSLVMPVAPGFQLDPTIDEFFDLFAQYYVDPPDPIRISVPTKGIYAESVIGQCNSCEEKDESRFWRWEESPVPDSPTTQILPINTDTRRADPGNLEAKDFPNPVVNIQNAPNLPDPTGLQGMLQLLGKGDAFRDLTGLNQTQLNALAAFQKSLDTAQSFGKEAAGLAKTAAANQLIEEALKRGAVSNEKAKELTEKNINSAIPQSPAEQIQAAQSRLGLIDTLEQQGKLSPTDAQEARKSIIGSLTQPGQADTSIATPANIGKVVGSINDSSISSVSAKKNEDGSEELSISRDNQANPVNQPAAGIDGSPEDRTFHPPLGFGITLLRPTAGLEQNNNLEFHWVLEKGMAAANATNDFTIGVSNFAANTAVFTDPGALHLLAKEPGIFKVSLIARDKTSKALQTFSTRVGVPQFVVVTESTAAYSADPNQPFYSGIANAHLFNAVLQRTGLASRRDAVLNKIRDTVNVLLQTVNVRVVWQVALSNGLLMDDKQLMLGFQIGKIPNYERDFVSTVELKGYPQQFGVHGVTYNSSVRTFNELTEIFPGMLDYPRSPVFSQQQSPVDFRFQQILIERDALQTRLAANPGDTQAAQELADILELWEEAFSRMVGHTMAHEVCHSLLGAAGGLTSQGHTAAGSNNLLSVFANSFQEATGIMISGNNFPKKGSYVLPSGFITTAITNIIQFAFAIDQRLKTQLDVMYAVPPTPPFDK